MNPLLVWSARRLVAPILVAISLAGVPQAPLAAAPPETLDRTVLPIPEPTYPPITELDARKATPPPRFEVKAPPGAPNVVIVLLDDLGFGGSRAPSGAVPDPDLRPAGPGRASLQQFHTTALCSPTRTALLTGRNHHSANMSG